MLNTRPSSLTPQRIYAASTLSRVSLPPSISIYPPGCPRSFHIPSHLLNNWRTKWRSATKSHLVGLCNQWVVHSRFQHCRSCRCSQWRRKDWRLAWGCQNLADWAWYSKLAESPELISLAFKIHHISANRFGTWTTLLSDIRPGDRLLTPNVWQTWPHPKLVTSNTALPPQLICP